jgi:hypothetical protein
LIDDNEHNFTGKLEDWDERVFRAATKRGGTFTTYRRIGHEKKVFRTFPEALQDIRNVDQSLIYAVAPTGRFINLPRSLWNKYARIWIDIRGREVSTKLVPFRKLFPCLRKQYPANTRFAYVLTKNEAGEYAVYCGVIEISQNYDFQINRIIMTGDLMMHPEAVQVFPGIRKDQYRS